MLQRSAKRRPQTWRTCIPPFPGTVAIPATVVLVELQRQKIDLLFLATPHEVSRALVGASLTDCVCRSQRSLAVAGVPARAFTDSAIPMKVTAAELTEKAVYGASGANGDRLPGAALVANPGCYATSVILPWLRCWPRTSSIGRRESFLIRSRRLRRGKEATARTLSLQWRNLSAYSVFSGTRLRRNS